MVKFNEFTKNKYSYLRLKKVEFFESDKVAKLHFSIPETIYEKDFDNSVIGELKKFCSKIASNYKCEFFFEKLIVSEEIVSSFVCEHLATECPFLASSINSDCVDVKIDDKIDVEIKIEQDVYDLIDGAPFVKNLIEQIEENFSLPTFLTFTLVPIGEIVVRQDEKKIVSKTSIPYEKFDYLCGIKAKAVNKPIFVDSIVKPMDNASIAGYVLAIDKRSFEKVENSPYKYFKYNYRIRINDYSGEFTAYYKTNDENCLLDSLNAGDSLLLAGRIYYSDRMNRLLMSVKSIFTVVLQEEKIKEILRPKPIPDSLKYPAEKYSGQDFLVKQTLFDFDNERDDSDVNCVFFTYRSVSKDFVPWEFCLLSFTDGKADSVYRKFVKVSNIERVDLEYRAKVTTAKRLAEYVPDILSFCKGKTVFCKNIDAVAKELKNIAKAQHMEFEMDLQEADKLGAKNGQKFEPTFERMLKENSITVLGNTSFDYAIAMAQLFLKVKK